METAVVVLYMKMALKIFVFALLSLLLPACNAALCCPRRGPSGLFLQEQQTSLVETWCEYGVGPRFRKCVYVTGVPPSPGCPALVTALFCPMTNVIHPNKDSTLCVTVLSYSNRGAVEVRPCTGANNQRFIFSRYGPLPLFTRTQIQAAGTNFCLDSVGGSRVPVTVTACADNFTNRNQTWYFSAQFNFILNASFYFIQRVGSTLRLRFFGGGPAGIWTPYP